ncbi:MAG TPA: FAD-dependent oxidoreductase, partial [Phenylobacterium sp.]|nr:FAD-dependent oxidoreductase [Phenylobacterium sp.]
MKYPATIRLPDGDAKRKMDTASIFQSGWTWRRRGAHIAAMGAPDADVIIAGAGIPGATLALALSQAGLAVTLIDPQPFEAQLAPTFDGRASAIAFASFRLWRA